jgi:hypothetical protein
LEMASISRARLQTLASAGGVCLSGAAHDQVRKILPLAFTDLGAQLVKNIEEPVRAFAVSAKGEAVAVVSANASTPLALPDKPSIAMLPFQNMSGDPEQVGRGNAEKVQQRRRDRLWLYDTLGLFNAYRVRRDGPKVAPAG